MNKIEAAEQVFKPLRPDARREVTDATFKAITNAEMFARQAKTRKLRQARLALSSAVRKAIR
jgi:hypothetical protein